MELASPISDCACRFFELIGKPIGYVRHLEENINSLKEEIQKLVQIKSDIEVRLRTGGDRNRQPLEEVSGWLQRVEDLKSGTEVLIAQGEVEIQQKCFLGFCPKNIVSSYKVAKKVSLELPKVIELKAEGKFEVVTSMLPRATLNDEMALGNTVGLDEKVKEVWNSLMDPMKKIIGIYGMGGIGKTTLMKRIKNKLARETHHFDRVIWIVASKDLNIDTLQIDIGKELAVYDHDNEWRRKNRINKASDIFNFLKKKRFMFLLDDLWEGLDLEEVGIPSFSAEENNNAKIVFTTRQEDVCRSMGASASIKIEPLQWEESWTLFMSKVGEEILGSHPRIRKLAEEVVKRCGGLPLALITIGRTMASKKTPQEWEYAVTTLKSDASKFSKMEEKVLSTLKFSYDNLSDEIIKQCFLYCSSFPEDHEIPENSLISLWIGEGFFDECDSISDAENLGHDIIGRLKLACLLENGIYRDDLVKMHDVIRDMALWIATDYGKNKNKILVGNHRMDKVPGTARWKEAQRISFEKCEIKEVDVTPDCSNLSTLRICRNTNLMKISDTFFQLMTALKVLDLSWNTHLRKLPKSLFELSSSLQYLDLSNTGIEEMPVELKNLGKLKYLLLRDMNGKLKFPLNVIPSLSMLVRLDLYQTSSFSGCDGAVLLDEMECLPDLQSTGVTVESEVCLQKLLSSRKLQEATRELSIKGVQGLTSLDLSSLLRNCKRLSEIIIGECDDLEQVVVTINESVEEKNNRATCCISNLKRLEITYNGALKKLEGVGYIPSLEALFIMECRALEEIIPLPLQLQREEGDHKALALFPGLKNLGLWDLPKLRSICPPHSNSRPLVVFPLLERIFVDGCRELRRLPLDTVAIMKNSSKLRLILAEKEWWAGLIWDDASFTPSLLSPYPL